MSREARRRPVVVAVSGEQPDLLAYAAGMAQMYDAPLRVVHAHSFQVGTGDLYEGRAAGKVLHNAAQRVLDEAQESLASHGVPEVEYTLRTEPPAVAIEMESADAALVVVGADDVFALERVLGADVARRAAWLSACPVVVVPPGVSGPAMTEILVALDVNNVVEDALGFAFDLADRTGAELLTTTVLAPRMEAEDRSWSEGRLRGHAARWRKRFPHVECRTEVLTGDPGDELARASRHAQLVVVGHPNQPHRAPLFGRRVASSLVRAMPCAVAVVPVATKD